MNMIESIKTCFSKYADFNGRAIRSEFWWWTLFLVIANIVISGLMFATFDWSSIGSDPAAAMGVYMSPMGIVGIIFGLGTIIPSLAVGARRLHDTGKSGWLQLLFLLTIIPLLGLIIYLVMIYLFVQKSQEGENKYG